MCQNQTCGSFFLVAKAVEPGVPGCLKAYLRSFEHPSAKTVYK